MNLSRMPKVQDKKNFRSDDDRVATCCAYREGMLVINPKKPFDSPTSPGIYFRVGRVLSDRGTFVTVRWPRVGHDLAERVRCEQVLLLHDQQHRGAVYQYRHGAPNVQAPEQANPVLAEASLKSEIETFLARRAEERRRPLWVRG